MEFHYIVVGAGSAGCVLANRLTEDPGTRVLLLEAGGADRNPLIHMPAGIGRLAGNKGINWCYNTEPEPELNNRSLWWPRGRVLGGSSSINAMCYVRAQPRDYDHWEDLGNPGWGWKNVLPLFKRSQNQERGASEFHGAGGYLNVKDLDSVNPLSDVFLKAAVAAGYPPNDDFNGPTQEGVGFYQVTQKHGRRCSVATSFLAAARSRPNLTVLTRAQVTRVLIKSSRAVGVEYLKGGRPHTARASEEVLLSGGAINSPQLLLLSGIGPVAELEAVGVKAIHSLPGVGKNLQDHLDICTLVRSKQPNTYDFNLLQEAAVAMRYLFTRSGPGATNAAEAGGFVCSPLAKDGRPDVQLHFVPALLDDHGRNRLKGHGYTMHACVLRPSSRGEITLRDNNPVSHPRINPRYLSHPDDWPLMIEAAKLSREIFAQAPFAAHKDREIYPGESATSDQDLVRFIRAKAETIYHPVGTCSMGPGADAVVDWRLKVHGLDGLRVVDASVMPTLLSGNTNAPTIMIAERASDLLRGLEGTGASDLDSAA